MYEKPLNAIPTSVEQLQEAQKVAGPCCRCRRGMMNLSLLKTTFA